MIYIDDIVNYGKQGRWCHCWSDTLDDEELMTFAMSIGLKSGWLQISHGVVIKDFPHFDLMPSKRKAALHRGAVEKSLSQWLREQVK